MDHARVGEPGSGRAEPRSEKPFLRVLGGEAEPCPPVWMMRQAGRYLPEYRALRAEAGSFLDLCYDPVFAAEVTLQPIRRFDFDAAILFSDILVVPHALGQPLWFVEGEGPRLEPVADLAALREPGDAAVAAHLSPVIETVSRVRESLDPRTALIGFCGAPWTVASYMIAGRGTPDLAPVRQVAAANPAFLDGLIERLVAASVAYLVRQLRAGADAVQIFESHAGTLPTAPAGGDLGAVSGSEGADSLGRWSLGPIARIVAGVREEVPGAKVIVFARNAGLEAQGRVARATGAHAVGIDHDTDLAAVRARLPARVATQGNLDPRTLVAGGEGLDAAVDRILAATRGHPHVFNLGHGIVPQTPIPNVARMLARIRGA